MGCLSSCEMDTIYVCNTDGRYSDGVRATLLHHLDSLSLSRITTSFFASDALTGSPQIVPALSSTVLSCDIRASRHGAFSSTEAVPWHSLQSRFISGVFRGQSS